VVKDPNALSLAEMAKLMGGFQWKPRLIPPGRYIMSHEEAAELDPVYQCQLLMTKKKENKMERLPCSTPPKMTNKQLRDKIEMLEDKNNDLSNRIVGLEATIRSKENSIKNLSDDMRERGDECLRLTQEKDELHRALRACRSLAIAIKNLGNV
jgi:hypothetical protein